MRPVADEFEVTQAFGSYATAGIVADWNGTEVQQLVAAYGNYQPYGHAGCDIGCPVGTPVHAVAGGTVLWADWGTNLPGDESDWGYRQRWYLYKTFPGIVTVIQHDGWIGVYAHLSEAWMNPDDVVTEGQVIGKSGNTRAPGQTLGAHLHVEALIDLSYSTARGFIYGRTDPTLFFGSGALAPAGDITPSEEDEMADYAATLGAIIGAVSRTEEKVKEIYDRVFGRDVQRWYNPQTLEVRTEAFPGGIPARSTDVHDIISTNNLIVSQSNRILDALSKVQGVDESVVAGLREQLAAELKQATDNLSVTLTVNPQEGK